MTNKLLCLITLSITTMALAVLFVQFAISPLGASRACTLFGILGNVLGTISVYLFYATHVLRRHQGIQFNWKQIVTSIFIVIILIPIDLRVGYQVNKVLEPFHDGFVVLLFLLELITIIIALNTLIVMLTSRTKLR